MVQNNEAICDTKKQTWVAPSVNVISTEATDGKTILSPVEFLNTSGS